jgi:hypothetical protein
MKLWMVITMVLMAEFGMHYFPWRILLRGRELPRLVAYVLGLLGMMGPFTAWLWDRDEIAIMQTLWIVIISAGFMVFALYGFDHYLDLIMKEMEAKEERDLRKDARQG